MKTEIEENELNIQLEKLHLKSKDWLSEIDFFQIDLEFLRKHIERNLVRLVDDGDFVCSSESLRRISATALVQADLKARIIEYRETLKLLLITQFKHTIDLSFIDKHNQIEFEIANILVQL